MNNKKQILEVEDFLKKSGLPTKDHSKKVSELLDINSSIMETSAYIDNADTVKGIFRAMGDAIKEGRLEQPIDLTLNMPKINNIFTNYHFFLSPSTIGSLSVESKVSATSSATLTSLGLQVSEPDLHKGCIFQCDMLNKIGNRGLIESALSPLSTMETSLKDNNDNKIFIVYSYLLILNNGLKYVNSHFKNFLFEEGGTPSKLEIDF
jgi:hypothetical protein